MKNVLSVSQLNRYVKALLEGNNNLNTFYLKGEISNFTNHLRSGHLYFTLKEGGAAVKCVMFASNAKGLIFTPKDGMCIIARCSVSLYERDGTYQVYVYDLQPDGSGALMISFNQLKQTLSEEGLFDTSHKLALAKYPENIAVVTSETGAALQDILSILQDRYPICRVQIYDVAVQGIGAAQGMVTALKKIQEKNQADCIIIGRGGGSIEDLWAFNDEQLARQIYSMTIPVISAVGHETDFTICDFVADVRAETPSAAAQLAVPSVYDVLYHLSVLNGAIQTTMDNKIKHKKSELARLSVVCEYNSPQKKLSEQKQRLQYFNNAVKQSIEYLLNRKEQDFLHKVQIINSLNPLKLLDLGYTITVSGKSMTKISSINNVKVGDKISTIVANGTIISTVEGSFQKNEKNNDL
ncbi:MAG: exodeoxyribonuclease VII large subunit [Oscillospiraceae bacterium]